MKKAVFLSFLLAFILVVVYERPNKLGHQPDIQVDQANVNSRPDFSNREDKNVSAELEENKDSRLKNREDIKLIDLCDEEYNELTNQAERINKDIKQLLLSFDNPSQVNDALTLLVKQQVISIPKAFRMMNYVEHKRALRGVVEINVNTPPSEAALSHLQHYKKVKRQIINRDEKTLTKLLEWQQTLPNVSLTIGKEALLLSADIAMTRYLLDIDNSRKEALPAGITFQPGVLVRALENKASNELIEYLLKNSEQANTKQLSRNALPTNPIITAIDLESLKYLKKMLKHFPKPKMRYYTPEINYLLAKVIRSKQVKLSAVQQNMFNILKHYQGAPVVWFDTHSKKYLILGHSERIEVTDAILIELEQLGIPIRQLNMEAYLFESDMVETEDANLLFLIRQSIEISQHRRDTATRCKQYKQEYFKTQPSYLDHKKAIKQYTKSDNTFYQNVERLANISPALVDHYYNHYRFESNVIDFVIANALLGHVIQGQYSQIKAANLKKQLNPREESYIVNQVCKLQGIEGVKRILPYINTIYFMALDNNNCITSKEKMAEIQDAFFSQPTASPSLVYSLIHSLHYYQALEEIKVSDLLVGYPKGRDSLALLLDQILSSNIKKFEEREQLLILLLQVTELKQMHYARLHRLKFKKPALFEQLYQYNSDLPLAFSYPFSQYK